MAIGCWLLAIGYWLLADTEATVMRKKRQIWCWTFYLSLYGIYVTITHIHARIEQFFGLAWSQCCCFLIFDGQDVDFLQHYGIHKHTHSMGNGGVILRIKIEYVSIWLKHVLTCCLYRHSLRYGSDVRHLLFDDSQRLSKYYCFI